MPIDGTDGRTDTRPLRTLLYECHSFRYNLIIQSSASSTKCGALFNTNIGPNVEALAALPLDFLSVLLPLFSDVIYGSTNV